MKFFLIPSYPPLATIIIQTTCRVQQNKKNNHSMKITSLLKIYNYHLILLANMQLTIDKTCMHNSLTDSQHKTAMAIDLQSEGAHS